MKRLIVLLLASLSMISCTSTISTPTGGSGTGGSGFSLSSGPLLEALISNTGGGTAQLNIATSSGAVTNAAVTLSTTGTSINLPYTASISAAVTYSGSITIVGVGYYSSLAAYTYTANQPYTMTASFGGNTYTASVTAVGNGAFTPTGSGLSCSWVGGGNENIILALQTLGTTPYSSAHFGPNLTTGYTIPNSALPNYTGGNYSITADLIELVTSCFPGAYAGSFFSATDVVNTVY